MQVMYAHLGLLEPGTAAVDRDGDVWCVWPDGMAGCGGPQMPPDIVSGTRVYGPFAVLATGLTVEQCDEIADAEQGDRSAARNLALRLTGRPSETGPLGPELGVESIDGPNGLRRFARLVGGRLGPDGQPETAFFSLQEVRDAVVEIVTTSRMRPPEVEAALARYPRQVVRGAIEHLVQCGTIHFDIDANLAPGSGWK